MIVNKYTPKNASVKYLLEYEYPLRNKNVVVKRLSNKFSNCSYKKINELIEEVSKVDTDKLEFWIEELHKSKRNILSNSTVFGFAALFFGFSSFYNNYINTMDKVVPTEKNDSTLALNITLIFLMITLGLFFVVIKRIQHISNERRYEDILYFLEKGLKKAKESTHHTSNTPYRYGIPKNKR